MAIKRKLPVLNPEVSGRVPGRVAAREPGRESSKAGTKPGDVPPKGSSAISTKPRAPGSSASDAKPTIERARARLGGPIGDVPPLPGFPGGTLVEITTEADRPLAVVLFASTEEVLLLVDAERVRRVLPTAIAATSRMPSDLLAELAVDARIFGWLVEGQEVCFTRPIPAASSAPAAFAASGATTSGDANSSGRGSIASIERGKLIAKCRYGGLVAKSDGKILAVGFRNLCPATTTGTV